MVNLPNIMIVGLTGMSGAGKSTVCDVFEHSGFVIIDCDKQARKIADNRDFLNELQSRFPDKILNTDGTLNRQLTAKAIFTNNDKRKLYNRIIFPYIVYDIIEIIKVSGEYVLLDAPTLFDAGLDIICTKIVGVTADFEVCVNRIIKRDGISRQSAEERLWSQQDKFFLKNKCDFILENNGNIDDFIMCAQKITKELKGYI